MRTAHGTLRRSYLFHHPQPNFFVVGRDFAAVVPVKRHVEISGVKQIFIVGNGGLPVAGQSAGQRSPDEKQADGGGIDPWFHDGLAVGRRDIEGVFFRTGGHAFQAGMAFVGEDA